MDHVLTTLAEGLPKARMLLLHDSNEPMDSPWLNQLADTISQLGVDVLRWELSYMHLRRTQPARKWTEPSLQPRVAELDIFLDQLIGLGGSIPLILAGKGTGAQLATNYVAKNPDTPITAVVSFGYPLPKPRDSHNHKAILLRHLSRVPCAHLVLQSLATRTDHAESLIPYVVTPETYWVWVGRFTQSKQVLNEYLDSWLTRGEAQLNRA